AGDDAAVVVAGLAAGADAVAAVAGAAAAELRVGHAHGREVDDRAAARKRRAAIRRLRNADAVGLVAAVLELAPGHVHVAVAGHGDLRQLNVVDPVRQLHRLRERDAVIRRPDKGDRDAPGARDALPGQLNVPRAGSG